jgi:phospholipid/cholesterol/gamma-HCH transport system substrate-binding protein
VGILVVVVGALSYFLIRSTNDHPGGANGYTVWGLFKDASGLFEKSRVQTAGISVGQIEDRKLDLESKRARITIRMKPEITLWENAVVTKKSASLLGEYYLEIDPGSEWSLVNDQQHHNNKLKNGDQIKTVVEPVVMGDMLAEVGTLIPILRDILGDVRKLTSGTITDIATHVDELIENNSEVLNSLLKRMDDIAKNVQGVTTAEADDVKRSIQNVRDITESIKTLIGTTKGEMAPGAVKSSIDRLQSTLDSLDHSMKNVETITNNIVGGKGTAGQLITDETIGNNVRDITEDAGSFVRGLSRLQTIVGLRSEYNFISSEFKNYLSITIMPRPDKFYLIELVEDPRGFREQTTTVTNSSITGTSSQTQVTLSDRLRFTLMFGKRVGPVAGRFGILESTGGAGVDLYLLDDRLSLSVDVFDMQTNQYPRIRPAASLAIWKRNFFLRLGADDVINFNRARGGAGGGIDWFLGAQLVFNDEDLKSLLLVGGGSALSSAGR